jgi:hypothetical protein
MTNQIERLVMLELWNHGAAGETIKPCGEVDVFNVTGERVPQIVLERLMARGSYDDKFDWFGDLPTETVLQVEAEIDGQDGEVWLWIKSWKELGA